MNTYFQALRRTSSGTQTDLIEPEQKGRVRGEGREGAMGSPGGFLAETLDQVAGIRRAVTVMLEGGRGGVVSAVHNAVQPFITSPDLSRALGAMLSVELWTSVESQLQQLHRSLTQPGTVSTTDAATQAVPLYRSQATSPIQNLTPVACSSQPTPAVPSPPQANGATRTGLSVSPDEKRAQYTLPVSTSLLWHSNDSMVTSDRQLNQLNQPIATTTAIDASSSDAGAEDDETDAIGETGDKRPPLMPMRPSRLQDGLVHATTPGGVVDARSPPRRLSGSALPPCQPAPTNSRFRFQSEDLVVEERQRQRHSLVAPDGRARSDSQTADITSLVVPASGFNPSTAPVQRTSTNRSASGRSAESRSRSEDDETDTGDAPSEGHGGGLLHGPVDSSEAGGEGQGGRGIEDMTMEDVKAQERKRRTTKKWVRALRRLRAVARFQVMGRKRLVADISHEHWFFDYQAAWDECRGADHLYRYMSGNVSSACVAHPPPVNLAQLKWTADLDAQGHNADASKSLAHQEGGVARPHGSAGQYRLSTPVVPTCEGSEPLSRPTTPSVDCSSTAVSQGNLASLVSPCETPGSMSTVYSPAGPVATTPLRRSGSRGRRVSFYSEVQSVSPRGERSKKPVKTMAAGDDPHNSPLSVGESGPHEPIVARRKQSIAKRNKILGIEAADGDGLAKDESNTPAVGRVRSGSSARGPPQLSIQLPIAGQDMYEAAATGGGGRARADSLVAVPLVSPRNRSSTKAAIGTPQSTSFVMVLKIFGAC